MRIDTIVNLIDADLVNSGYISDILFFADDVKKVKRESLFISNNIIEIKEAIKKGVYAILFSENLEVLDDEIAWIKVENINEALLKLLKYKILDKTLYTTDEMTIQILKSLNKDKKLAIIESLKVDYLNNDYIFITSLDRIKNISVNVKNLEPKIELKFLDTTIFMTEFLYKDKKYSIMFPSVYKNKLNKSLSFLESLNLNYSLKTIKLNRFIPQFINNRYEKVGFGKTNKVVISGIKKDTYFIKELNYIFEKIKYANVKFYDKTNIDNFYIDEFNFAVLIDCEVELKEKQEIEKSLF